MRDGYSIYDGQDIKLCTSADLKEGKTYTVTYKVKANKDSVVEFLPNVKGDITLDTLTMIEDE